MESVIPFLHHLKQISSSYMELGFIPKYSCKDKSYLPVKPHPAEGSITHSLTSPVSCREKRSKVLNHREIFVPFECCGQTFKHRKLFSNHLRTAGHAMKTYCDVCEEQFRTTKDLVLHFKLGHNPTVYVCEVCSAHFKRQSSLKSHLNDVHSLTADWCSENADKLKSLTLARDHSNFVCPDVKDEETKQGGPYKCCGRTFNYYSHYERHINTLKHSSKIKCCMCQSVFDGPESLEEHRKQKHNFIGSRWKCQICGSTFSSNGILSNHLQTKHFKYTTYDCATCQAVFHSKWSLTRHVTVKHMSTSLVPTFSCDTCFRQFKRKDHLRSHVLTHQDERLPVFKCKECPFVAYSNTSVWRHNKAHTAGLQPYQCSICEKQYLRKDSFQKHMKSHQSSKSQCSVCKVFFQSAEDLKLHESVHRPCQVCGLVVTGGNKKREQHLRTHLSRKLPRVSHNTTKRKTSICKVNS